MSVPDIILAMRRLNTGEHAPVWDEEDQEMHDSGCDTADKRRSLLTEGLRKEKEKPITTKPGPTLQNGQTRERKRVTFADAAPIPAMTDQNHTMSIINKLAAAEPKKRAFTAVVPVYAVAIGTTGNSDPRKPMLNSEVGMNEPSDSQNRMLSDLIRTLDHSRGRRTRNGSKPWQWPPPGQREKVDAATSLQDVQKNQKKRRRGSSSAPTEPEQKKTKVTHTDDSDDESHSKWPKVPGHIWKATTAFVANTVDHLPFYTPPKEKQWQEATLMWQRSQPRKA
ncbi:hypothetical protein N0V85_006330 [Neurospora sp. IMI 360204]|nr:hypothetical protein N0V85_006330 [Neurospora sp. IMI 360204]